MLGVWVYVSFKLKFASFAFSAFPTVDSRWKKDTICGVKSCLRTTSHTYVVSKSKYSFSVQYLCLKWQKRRLKGQLWLRHPVHFVISLKSGRLKKKDRRVWSSKGSLQSLQWGDSRWDEKAGAQGGKSNRSVGRHIKELRSPKFKIKYSKLS